MVPDDRWRIVRWSEQNNAWVLYRASNGKPLEFRTEAEVMAALHTLRAHRIPGRFRIHRGAVTRAKSKAQGHRLTPPKDLFLRMHAS